MPQIQCPIDYVPLQQVTAANLNAHVNSAVILSGIITDQTNITANTVASGDSILLYDLSVAALREANISDVLRSNLPVTTSAITAGANSDVVITSNDGVVVAGSSYVSGDGLTVVVTTLAAHGLLANNVVLISGAGTGYNGTFKITAVTSLTFTYVRGLPAATPAAFATACTYVRKASEIVHGNIVATKSVFVTENITSQGNLIIKGQTQLENAPTIGGKSLPQLYDVVEVVVPTASWGWGNNNTAYTYDQMFLSSTYVKPVDEIWIIEVDMKIMSFSASSSGYSLVRGTNWKMETVATTGGAVALANNWVQKTDGIGGFLNGSSGYSNISLEQFDWKYVIPKTVAFDGKFKISAQQNIPQGWANTADGFTAISPISAGTNANQAFWQGLATVASAGNIATNFPWRTTFRIFKHKVT